MRFLWPTVVAIVGAGCFSKPPDLTGTDAPPRDGPPGDQGIIDAMPDAPEVDGPPIGNCDWPAIASAANIRLYLPLDGPGSTVQDSSVLDHTVTAYGGATTVPGRVTRSMSFHGNDRAEVTEDADLDNLGPLSVCSWIYLDEPVTNVAATIIDKSLDGNDEGWNFYVEESTGQRLGFLSTKRWYVHGNAPVPTKQWVHVCATWDGTDTATGIKLYRNGLVEPIAGTQAMADGPLESDAAHPLVIGRQSTMDRYQLRGRIDELYLFAGVISSADVAVLHSCAQ